MRARPKYTAPAPWMKPGAKALYYSIAKRLRSGRLQPKVLGRCVVIRSEPWQLAHGEWIVKVEGLAGGLGVDFLEAYDEKDPAHLLACDALCAPGCDIAAAERRLDVAMRALRTGGAS